MNRLEAEMVAMTDEEVREFIAKNEWCTGLKVNDSTLYYDDFEANAVLIKFPETPLRATYFARVASMLGIDDESSFYGAMLWITLFGIGSLQLEKTGWSMIEMMRRGFGENRPLEVAPGHWFRNGAVVELAAFVLPCFVFGWDAYIIPSNGDLFIQISHDEYWTVITRTEEAHAKAMKDLESLGPEGHQGMLQRFCPHSKHIHATQ
jgi:hypothetical protein